MNMSPERLLALEIGTKGRRLLGLGMVVDTYHVLRFLEPEL
jgi:hypothetical protein